MGDQTEFQNRLQLIENREKNNEETLLGIGQMYLSDLKDLEKAYNIFNELYQNNPNNIEYMYATVQSLARMDKLSEAISILENWILLHPNDTQIKDLLNNLKGQV